MNKLISRILRTKYIQQYSSSPALRRVAKYRILKRIARKNDFQIYKKNLIWTQDGDFLEAKARGITGIPDDRCFVLLEIARRMRSVTGDIAECGTRFGRSASFMLTGCGQPTDKSLFLFDSFEGLSEPTSADAKDDGETYWRKGDILAPVDIVQENLKDYGNVHVMKGWIPDRFAEVADRSFSLVHIDVDLYQPTMDSLEFFYPRMTKGGFVVCDDYGSENCPGAKRAFDEFFQDKPQTVLHLPTGQCIVAI
ncbi:TylF/MycF/NovP-related O-methyltransferase [Mesorhizobium sp. ASY16-5R]|uniref:TylF/MycF/NovP-related O-methyltransferase n=1 Tax=Mesorhizobium sp. ASY16-5R TaxID=3445772 RepID=UPI003FA00235